MQKARERFEVQHSPQKEMLLRTRAALRENQKEVDKVVATVTLGQVADALLGFLNRRAQELQIEREGLLQEARKLESLVAPESEERLLDAAAFQQRLGHWGRVREAAKPEELQQVLRVAVKNVARNPSGAHKIAFYPPVPKREKQENTKSNRFPLTPAQNVGQGNRLDFDRRRDASSHFRVEPIILQVALDENGPPDLERAILNITWLERLHDARVTWVI